MLNNALASLLLLKQDYRRQTSASRRTGGRSFTSPSNCRSKTVLGKHNYSWKHFRVTLLSGGMKSFREFLFLPLNLSVFFFFFSDLRFPQARLNPPTKLSKLSSDYVALTVCLTKKKQFFFLGSEGGAVMKRERAHRGSELNWVTRVRRDSVLYITAFLHFLPTRLEFAPKLQLFFNLKKRRRASHSFPPARLSLLCI